MAAPIHAFAPGSPTVGRSAGGSCRRTPHPRTAGLRLLPLLLLTACSGGDLLPDPRSLPYRFEVVREFGRLTLPVDLRGDGRDEFIQLYTYNAPPRYPNAPRHDAILLLTPQAYAFEQLNYIGTVLPPHFVDVSGDSLPELAVPLLRNDSLFLSVADGSGRKLFSFYVASGRPRYEPEGGWIWQPTVPAIYAADVTGDGSSELITVLVGDRGSEMPRGVLVHRTPEGTPVGAVAVGAFMHPVGLFDLTGDGRPELLVSSAATNNQAAAGGFDDQSSHLIAFRLWPRVEVAWSRQMGGLGSRTIAAFGAFLAQDEPTILALTTSDVRGASARMELIAPGTWRTLRQRTFPEHVFHLTALDLTGDARPEIVVSTVEGEIIVLDGGLEPIERRFLSRGHFYVRPAPDLDGDGIGEIVAATNRGLVILDGRLEVKALAEGFAEPLGRPFFARSGVGTAPDLLGFRGDRYYLLRLVPNPFAWFWRWGRWALLGAGSGILLGLLAGFIVVGRDARRQRAVQALAVDATPHGLLLLTGGGRVRWVNATLRRWVGGIEVRRWRGEPLEEVLAGAPEVLAFCREALAADPPRHLEAEGRFRLGGEPRELRLVAEPIRVHRQGGSDWLVRFEDRMGEVELREARGWALVAEGVAHDFHKPLSGMGQEIDRLRQAYRRLAPEAGPDLDAYADDIKGRIVTLLQKADELRQVLGGGEPRLEQTPLNEFVNLTGVKLRRALPEDIGLDLRAADDAPAVQLDRRLMHSVLKNLVDNAVDAMREGGTITVSTGLVRGARIMPEAPPRDYARLEVSDTGVGIPTELRERIWEPGFTTHRETGWGLGLASVRRIVEAHRGTICVESEPGVGAAFAIYLPAADGVDGAEKEPAP